MEHRLNTIDPTVATRWITEYENNEKELIAYQVRYREGRKPFVERRGSITECAEAAGLNRKAFLDELKERDLKRKIEALSAGDDGEEAEQKELLKNALGGLPLGDWGLENMGGPPSSGRKKSAAVPGATPAAPDAPLTLAEAKEILTRPKGKGRPSAAVLAQRKVAERIVAEADREAAVDAGLIEGASGEKAAALAEAMEAHEASEADNVRDFRPRYMQRRDEDAPPPEAA